MQAWTSKLPARWMSSSRNTVRPSKPWRADAIPDRRAEVLFIHARLIAETGGLGGVRDLAMLESAVGSPSASFDGKDLYPDLFSKAAALMESLINNHPFVDGNKRAGITAAALFLRINGFKLDSDPADLERTTLAVAQGEMKHGRGHQLPDPEKRPSRQVSIVGTLIRWVSLFVTLVVKPLRSRVTVLPGSFPGAFPWSQRTWEIIANLTK